MMKIQKISLWDYKSNLGRLIFSIRNNKPIIATSDTVFGFLAPLTQEGFDALNILKQGRSGDKAYLILIASLAKLQHFIDMPLKNERLMHLLRTCWPGPVTIIFQAKNSLPSFLKSPDGTIALRCPKHQGLLEILEHVDGLFSTSANKSGKPIPLSLDTLDPDLYAAVPLIVLDRLDPNEKNTNMSSTLIDCSRVMHNAQHKIRVVRKGLYPITKLEEYYGESFEE